MVHDDALGEAVRQASDPMGVMQRVADQALAAIDHADGTLIALKDQADSLLYVCGSGRLAPHIGLRIGLDGSLSGVAVKSKTLVSCDDTSADPRVDDEACRRLEVASSVCVPLVHRDEAFGVLNVSSSIPAAFDVEDELVLRALADFVGVVVASAADIYRATSALLVDTASTESWRLDSSHTPDLRGVEGQFVTGVLSPHMAERLSARKRIEQVLRDQAFSMVFQPVFRLDDMTLLGYEALARFRAEPARTPDRWFAEAHDVGLGTDLELAAVHEALRHLGRLPPDTYLAVNAGPQTVTRRGLLPLLGSVESQRVVVELTEHAQVEDYTALVKQLDELRSTGARLAIDDTGAGISSLAHILQLAPDVIKLDRALTTGIDRDPVRRALASSLVRFTSEVHAEIVAEGIETSSELTVLRNLGIRSGQGFYLGEPAPL